MSQNQIIENDGVRWCQPPWADPDAWYRTLEGVVIESFVYEDELPDCGDDWPWDDPAARGITEEQMQEVLEILGEDSRL